MIDNIGDIVINNLLSIDKDGCLITPELFCVEYKKEFNFAGFDNKYIKTINGLTNNKGGYIIFGVENGTRSATGMDASSLDMFNRIDKERIIRTIKTKMVPAINIEYKLAFKDGKNFGIIYIPELKHKPSMFIVDSDEYKIGDIFFRNNEEVSKIAYADLQNILEEKRIREQEKWMALLGKIAKIGAHNIFILDTQSKSLYDSSDNIIHIDEKIITKLLEIQNSEDIDSQFKLFGDILNDEEFESSPQKAILEKDFVKQFLDQKIYGDPFELVKFICASQSTMPIYYFIVKIGAEEFVKKFNALKSQLRVKANYNRIKANLLDEEKTNFYPLVEHRTDSQKRKWKFSSLFIDEKIKALSNLKSEEINFALDSILSIDKHEIRKHDKFIFEYMKKIMPLAYDDSYKIFTVYKKALLWIDEALYRDQATKHTGYINLSEKSSGEDN